MKENKSKKQILEQLRKMPLIQVACEKSGVARASFYRWKQKDKEFAKEINTAIAEGEAMITDMSEMQLISLIRDKNFQAVQLWLKSHHSKYGNKLEVTGNLNIKEEPLTPEQQQLVEKSLTLAGIVLNDKNHDPRISKPSSADKPGNTESPTQ
jgi:hypothetical protein